MIPSNCDGRTNLQFERLFFFIFFPVCAQDKATIHPSLKLLHSEVALSFFFLFSPKIHSTRFCSAHWSESYKMPQTKAVAWEDVLTPEYFVMSGWANLYTTVIMVFGRCLMSRHLRWHKLCTSRLNNRARESPRCRLMCLPLWLHSLANRST